MNSALWAAKTGLDAQQTRMTVVSHNLANASTNGFKKDRAVFEDLLYQNVSQVGAATSQDSESPTGLNIGTGVRIVATEKNHTQGSLNTTGNGANGPMNIEVIEPTGPDTLAIFELGGTEVIARLEPRTVTAGHRARLDVNTSKVVLFDPDTEQRIA